MRVLLPAAGSGSRLGKQVPKILIEVGGRSILHRHLDSLASIGISRDSVTVVTGFRRDILEKVCVEEGVKTLFNPCWRFPGTLGSFYALPPSDHDLLVIHGDLVWENELIAGILCEPGDVVLPVDPGQREDSEAMKAETRGNTLLHLSKDLPVSVSSGESMGVFLVRRHRKLHELVTRLAEKPEASLDDGINLAAGRMEVRILFDSRSCWEEVDTLSDLRRAEEKFHEKR